MSIRFAAALWALVALALQGMPALAHEGHDHGEAPPVVAELGPRAEAVSACYELLAVPRGDHLMLYLDGFRSNAPVADAKLAVETPDGRAEAQPQGDGSYRLPAPWLARGGHNDLVVTVSGGDGKDTLTLDLDLPEPAAASAQTPHDDHSLLEELREHLGGRLPVGTAAGGFLLGLATLGLARAGRRLPALAVLAATLALLIGGTAFAHEGGHDDEHEHTPHSSTPAALTDPAAPVIERARLLPDGSIFVPKATQHLLGLRTVMTEMADHARMIELPGRVIADPNASGVVQSSVGGRLAPPPGGFPELGARVKRGDVLAVVTPPVQAVDVSDMRQTQGNLDQQIAILARRVARYERLAISSAVPQFQLDDAKAELSGLKDRRAALDTARRDPETLVAPVDGVVAERAALAGQLAPAGTLVFRIVDPQRLYVEALSFQAVDPGKAASARLPGGAALKLAYRGEGMAERNQAVPVQFAVLDGADALRLGQFVTVQVPVQGRAAGLALPRAGVIRSESGTTVFEHVSAERFAPRAVRVEPLDAERVIVGGGLAPGKRIVTQGAELIDQVR